MNGTIKLFLNPKAKLPLMRRQYFVITGGRFMECPEDYAGVKMAKEIRKACVVDIPTEDYHTPERKVLYRGLNKAVDLILAGEPIYVGCMGGIGRTGLFLAVLAKAFGQRDPVKYVRANYIPNAVETEDQQKYIKELRITPGVRRKIKLARRRAYWRVWTWRKRNLTRLPVRSHTDAKRIREAVI